MERKIRDFNNNQNYNLEPLPVYARILDIQSELGELAKEYLKHSEYGTANFELTEDFKLEFGDIMYSLFSLAQELDLDTNECVDKVLKKYQDRIQQNNSMGSQN